MSLPLKEFQHLRISLEDIKLATKDFTDCIGQGGFGKVYKGELVLSEAEGLTLVAVKRLTPSYGQGTVEFWREITLLTRYKHDNVVSLLGFCDEGRENILVYEYLPNKSLDLYLSNTNLSWNRRLQICLGAAHGLQYLHEPFEGSQQRVLHRDIKSANILLDENWKPKISDFGLSKYAPANQPYTYQFSTPVGTMGYVDPSYALHGFLTKESDMYSFGVVLFEVLCGRRCVPLPGHDDRRFLPALARQCYEEHILDTIVDNSLKDNISPECLERFTKIAYQCLESDRTKRPLVTDLVNELEIAFQYQEEYEFQKQKELKRSLVLESDSDEYWDTKLPKDLEIIIRTFEIPDNICTLKKELFSFLHKGILFDEEKKFFWINNIGKNCLAVSSTSFLDVKQHKHLDELYRQSNSRFSKIVEYSYSNFYDVECQIKTSMLSLGTMYEARLIVKYREQPNVDLNSLKWITIRWKTTKLRVRSTQPVELTSDNWCMVKMWRFVNYRQNADFDITIEGLLYAENPRISSYGLLIQGIEFHPVDMMENENSKVIEGPKISDDKDRYVDADEYWEKRLPDDYQRYIEMSDMPLNYTTKKQLYDLLCEGFYCDNGQLWLSLCKSSSGMCCMLPAIEVLRDDRDYEKLEKLSLSESRFGEGMKLTNSNWYRFTCNLRSTMFSPHHTYACYLVCKLVNNNIDTFFGGDYSLDGNHAGEISSSGWDRVFYPMNIPTIIPTHELQASSSIPIFDEHGSMEQEEHGWKKVLLCKPHRLQDHALLRLKVTRSDFSGVIVAGIEFRPCI